MTGTSGQEFPITFLALCTPCHEDHSEGEKKDLAFSQRSKDTHVIVGEWWVRPLTLAGVHESLPGLPVTSWQHMVPR